MSSCKCWLSGFENSTSFSTIILPMAVVHSAVTVSAIPRTTSLKESDVCITLQSLTVFDCSLHNGFRTHEFRDYCHVVSLYSAVCGESRTADHARPLLRRPRARHFFIVVGTLDAP